MMAHRRLFAVVAAVSLLFGALSAKGQDHPQMVQAMPPGVTVLTNQTRIPVYYQTYVYINKMIWQTHKIAPGVTVTVRGGCYRLSTGQPAVTVYYDLERGGRYAFRGEGHNIVLHFNEANGDLEVTRARPNCAQE